MTLRAVQLPSLADELAFIPARCSDPTVNRTRPAPHPDDFRDRPVRTIAHSTAEARDKRRTYMREYMRRQRERIAS